MVKEIEMNIESFKEVLRRTHFKNNDIAIFVLERLETELNSELKAIYPINLGTDDHKKFIGYTSNCLIVAYSKDIEVEKIDKDTEEKYTTTDREIIINKIPKSSIKNIKLIEHSTEGYIYGGSLELYIDLDVECDKEKTIHLNSGRDCKNIKNTYELYEDRLMDTIELLAKELA